MFICRLLAFSTGSTLTTGKAEFRNEGTCTENITQSNKELTHVSVQCNSTVESYSSMIPIRNTFAVNVKECFCVLLIKGQPNQCQSMQKKHAEAYIQVQVNLLRWIAIYHDSIRSKSAITLLYYLRIESITFARGSYP